MWVGGKGGKGRRGRRRRRLVRPRCARFESEKYVLGFERLHGLTLTITSSLHGEEPRRSAPPVIACDVEMKQVTLSRAGVLLSRFAQLD